MIIWNKKMYWMKDTNYISKFGKRQVYQVFGPLKCHLIKTVKRQWLPDERRSLQLTFYEMIVPQNNYQVDIDQLYDSETDLYYIIRGVEPYSSFMVKNYVRVFCDEAAKFGEA